MAPRPFFPLFIALLGVRIITAADASSADDTTAPETSGAQAHGGWRGVDAGGAEDWWGAGDPAHCVETQRRFPDAVKVAVDIAGFAVCGRPSEAVCDDLVLTPVANMTCEDAVPHFFGDCGLICPIGMAICFVGIVTNTLTVVGVFGAADVLDPRHQTVLLIGLQSLTDFVMAWACTLSFAPPFYNHAWQGGRRTCDLSAAFLHCCAVATILSICLLTYISTTPLRVASKARTRRWTPPTTRTLAVWYGSVWAFAFAYALAPLAFGAADMGHAYGRYALHPGAGACFAETRGTTFNIYLTIVLVFASCGYMVFAYGKMFGIVRRFMRSEAKAGSIADEGLVTSKQARDKVAQMRKQVKVLRMLVVIVAVYLANWVFALVQFLLGAAGYENYPPLLTLWTAIGAVTNSAVNPLIYTCMNPKFREMCTTTWRRVCAGTAKRIGLPDPVAAYDRRAALRSVAPTGHAGPATTRMASTVVPSDSGAEELTSCIDSRQTDSEYHT